MARRLHFLIFMAVIVLAPLPLGSNRPWSWSLLAALIGLLCATWPMMAMIDRTTPWVRVRQVAFPLLGYAGVIGWAWLQTMPIWPPAWADPLWLAAQRQLAGGSPDRVPLAMDIHAAATGIMRLLCYGGVMWLALQHGRSHWRAQRMLEILALAGGTYALYGLMVFVAGNETILMMPKWAYPDSLTATFVNRNSFATYAGLTLLCAMACLMHRLPPPLRLRSLVMHIGRPTALYGLAALLLLLALIASGSRAGTASALLGLVTLIVMRRAVRQAPGPARWPILGAAAMAAGLVMAAALGLLLGTGALDGDFADRQRVYHLTLDLIAAQPWLGHGLGSFAARFATVRPIDLPHVWTEAHNSYLELAFDLGIPALLLMLAVTAWFLVRCVQGGVQRHRDALYPLLGVAVILLVGFHSLFDFSLQIPAVTVTWAAILGMAVAQSWRHDPTAARRRRSSSAGDGDQGDLSDDL
jgi:O-antigen ligase